VLLVRIPHIGIMDKNGFLVFLQSGTLVLLDYMATGAAPALRFELHLD